MNRNTLYILYQGKETAKDLNYHKNTLFSFDGQLSPQVIFKLKQPIFAFDMDWQSNNLYGLTHLFKNNFIVQIKMP